MDLFMDPSFIISLIVETDTTRKISTILQWSRSGGMMGRFNLAELKKRVM